MPPKGKKGGKPVQRKYRILGIAFILVSLFVAIEPARYIAIYLLLEAARNNVASVYQNFSLLEKFGFVVQLALNFISFMWALLLGVYLAKKNKYTIYLPYLFYFEIFKGLVLFTWGIAHGISLNAPLIQYFALIIDIIPALFIYLFVFRHKNFFSDMVLNRN